MSRRVIELALEVEAAASGSVDAVFDDVGSGARRMADDVDAASGTVSSRFDAIGESADDMGSKSSQAAGGLGDLGGALALMPGPLGAVGAGMEAVAPAIMGVTGASDLLNLATKSNIVTTTRARAAAIAHAATSRASAAATRAWAVAQRVLNLTMLASPVGLIVAGVLLLVGAIVLAYKRSETFRNIVDGAMSRARDAVGWVVDKVSDLVGWIRDSADTWGVLKDKAVSAAEWIRDKVGAAFEVILSPIQNVVDAVEWLLDLLSRIDIPDVPDWVPGVGDGRAATTAPALTTGGTTVTVNYEVTIPVTVDALTDRDALATQLRRLLDDQAARLGETLSLAVSPA